MYIFNILFNAFQTCHQAAVQQIISMCYCKSPTLLQIAMTEKNMGWRFIGCRNFPNGACKFFHWIDNEKTTSKRMYVLHKRNYKLEKINGEIEKYMDEVKKNDVCP